WLNQFKDSRHKIYVHTDSSYVIQGAEGWIKGWKKSGWKTKEGKDVANRDLWEQLDALTSSAQPTPEWVYVAGHTGVPGNERTDEIAVAYSLGELPRLYQGPLSGYTLTKEDLLTTEGKKTNPRSRSKLQALHYLSLVGRVPMRHKTWVECESRVRGQTGAKFKKVTTPDEEGKILLEWGYKKEDVKE
ncbi:MAG: RNase H family protein, partial [Bdellovibrionota bacterium]